MATYYVGKGGNDGNNGLTWAQRKLTMNGAEDIPVVANDTVYVGPGAYREMLTVDVSGNAGNEIEYIADTTGEHTDGVGGVVRVTGSDNDQTAARANCIVASSRDYRTFRGFRFDTSSAALISGTDCDYWVIEDCTFDVSASYAIWMTGTSSEITIQRCFINAGNNHAIYLTNAVYGASNGLIENITIVGHSQKRGIHVGNWGGITVRNCLLYGCNVGLRAEGLVGNGGTCTINNSQVISCWTGLSAAVLGDITEDFNNAWANLTARVNTNVGTNSVAYPPLLLLPLLHSGAGQASGFAFPLWFFGELSEWSPIRALTGGSQSSVDMFGIGRPTDPADHSWGPLQFMDAERDTGTVHGGSASLRFNEAGRKQIFVPTTNVQTTIATWVYRGTGYVGTNPQMVIKQPGVADRTTTDAGGAGGWNQLSDTFTPAADPPWVAVELVSNYGTSTSTTSSSTSTTSTSTTSTSTTTLTSTSTSSLSTSTTSLSTSTTSTSSTTLPYDVYFDDLTVT